ncbi:Hypothetical protein KK9_1090 (plasmid) [Borreliella garinii BgVir]|nr:Hypothetical protein KK9_1090 [Borreliella garinii BgVir]
MNMGMGFLCLDPLLINNILKAKEVIEHTLR